ncbi:MAG: DUF456 domain-containing protein [Elainellaceae cyanobacterium]
MDLFTLYWILVAVMVVGALGELIPGMPGASLILISILVWAIATNFTGIGWSLIVVFTLLILSAAVELLAAYWGAKQAGASRWGQFGALVGLVAGVIGLLPALPIGGPLLGIFVGPFVGAFIAEYIYRSDLQGSDRLETAFKASLGTVLGSIVGNLVDGLLAVLAVVVFVLTTYPTISSL